jgi:hypothetical protein
MKANTSIAAARAPGQRAMFQARASGRTESDEAQQVLREAAAHEDHDQTREHQRHQYERGRHVDRLAPQEAAAAVHLEDDVECSAGRLQGAGRSIERDHDADRQSGRRGLLVLQGGAEGAIERVDHRGRGDVAQVAQDRVVGLGILAQQAEQR